MLLTSNRSLAEESLARRPRLNNGKLQLAEKYRELSNLATTCWEKQSQLGKFAPTAEETKTGRGGGQFWVFSSFFFFFCVDGVPAQNHCQDISQDECGCDDRVTVSESKSG